MLVTKKIFAMLLLFMWMNVAQAEEKLMPFMLASVADGDIAEVVKNTNSKLIAAGFEVVGEYSPYDDASIIIITSDELKKGSAQSKFGGYAAGQRISITKVGNEIQVAFTSPVYMSHAYRMKADFQAVEEKLKTALGFVKIYGVDEGMVPEDIREYHYMFGMEYFDDPSLLAEYGSYEEALAAVEKSLAMKNGGVSKVYQINITGKKETVFGVQLTHECSADKFVMGHIDFKPVRSTAHLPYEMLVSGKKIYALYARFRIAINFPELKMMGANSFFKIMCAPDAIEQSLLMAAGKSQDEEDMDE